MLRTTICLLACTLLVASLSFAHAEDTDVRVRLLDRAQVEELTISARGGGLTLFAGSPDAVLTTLDEHQTVTIARRGEELRVETDETQLFVLELGLQPEDGAEFEINVQKARRTIEPRTYQGALYLRADDDSPISLRLINHVPLEQYVASVVSSEYSFDDVEGAKAMAVLVRTYALRSKFGMEYDHVDNVISQAYRGTTELTEAAIEATRQTHGQVLTHAGSLIEAVYFSSSGGHTANNEDVWDGRPLPYLRGREDPYDASSPYGEWQARASRSALLNALSTHYGMSVRGFVIADRSDEGRVRTIELLTDSDREPVRANEFRLVANRYVMNDRLRSTFFDARREGEDYVFTGQGFGHGVGLSQYGALALSREGRSYEEILNYYFADVSLQQMDSLPFEPEMPLITEALPAISDEYGDPLEVETSESTEQQADEATADDQDDDEPRRTRRIGW